MHTISSFGLIAWLLDVYTCTFTVYFCLLYSFMRKYTAWIERTIERSLSLASVETDVWSNRICWEILVYVHVIQIVCMLPRGNYDIDVYLWTVYQVLEIEDKRFTSISSRIGHINLIFLIYIIIVRQIIFIRCYYTVCSYSIWLLLSFIHVSSAIYEYL